MLRHRTLARSKFLAAVGIECLVAYASSRDLDSPRSLADDEIDRWVAALDEPTRVEVNEDWSTINDVADNAVDAQGRALEALRRGAQGLAQALQQQYGLGPGPGQPGRTGPPRAQQDTDPLGRPLRGRDYGDDVTVKVPGEIDVQRARRILEELRRRFADPLRPQLELDYIERLLRGF